MSSQTTKVNFYIATLILHWHSNVSVQSQVKVSYGGKLGCCKNLAKLTTDLKFAKFPPSYFYTSMVNSHVSVVMSILQYFKHEPVKPESATDE